MDPSMNDEWQRNATRWLGVPLHPLGELGRYTFVSGSYDREHPLDRQTIQARLRSFQFQIALAAVLLACFTRNLLCALRVFRLRPHNPTVWCCIFGSFLGVATNLLALASPFSEHVHCRHNVWFITIAINLSIAFSSAIVLRKAYLALCKQYWVALLGSVLIVPQFGFIYILVHSPVTLTTREACLVHYPYYLPWYWLAVTTPINVFFSAIFTHVAYRQYRALGTAAWKELARDGIQTMSQIVLCNIVCEVLIVSRVGGGLAELFFIIDWWVARMACGMLGD
ncbi:hypothetical protein SYNPS1DRAFT_28391 [Syncephalis pseudoplumigaleata]|uniref:Uncharacterized protein n=1 Tax=Syncephalis pseudoplumigaleata TaxID=1712513 RepID=A0A4P9Z0E7_9FUNG|nr:hypothetical protein SYNPS1DRAFT_28391 [Syncephalis pseudoplumigaleata]|eukprot:RKP25886.1 hypothetical protein SYNPS1DRAFT_28391 [Syncephalis pseudoplumigaleata]